MADIFITGAGFSKNIHPSMPLMTELSLAVAASLSRQLTTGQEKLLEDDLEGFLSYLALHHPWLAEAEHYQRLALYHDAADAVRECIVAAASMAEQAPLPEWLRSLARYWHETRSTVITLNYDTLIERAVRTLGLGGDQSIGCADIYPPFLCPAVNRTSWALGVGWRKGASFTLLKLHGSTNWFAVPTQGLAQVYYISVWRQWGVTPAADERVALEDDEPDYVGDLRAMIVPPVSDKAQLLANETVRGLWASDRNALAAAERVYCVGYSLPSTDHAMGHLLTDALADSEAPVFVVNPSPAVADRFTTVLGGRVDRSFVGADCVARMVADLLA